MKIFQLFFLVLLQLSLNAQVPPSRDAEKDEEESMEVMMEPGDPDSEPDWENTDVQYYKKDNRYGFKIGDSIVVPPIYDNVYQVEDAILVYKGNKMGVLSNKGKLIVPIMYDSISIVYQNRITYHVKLNNSYGVFNREGKKILSPVYKHIYFCWPEEATSLVENTLGEKQLVFGNESIFPERLDNIILYNNGVIASKEGKYGFVKDGIVKIPFEYDSIFSGFHNMYRPGYPENSRKSKKDFMIDQRDLKQVIVFKNNKYFIMSTAGEMLMDDGCDNINYDPSRRIFHLKKDNRRGVYFEDNAKKLDIIYQPIYTDGVTFITVQKDHKKGIFDYSARLIVPIEYDEVSNMAFGSGFKVTKNNKVGWLDTKGKEILPVKYDEIYDFSDGDEFQNLYKVKIDTLFGVVDNLGKTIVPARFEHLFVKGKLFMTIQHSKWGVYTKEGVKLYEPVMDYISQSNTEGSYLLFLHSAKRGGIIDEKGNKLFDNNLIRIDYLLNEDGLYNPITNNGIYCLLLENDKGKAGIFDEQKKQLIIPFEYDGIEQKFEKNNRTYLLARKGKKYGIITDQNKIVIPFEYDAISFDKLQNNSEEASAAIEVAAKKLGKWGVINFSGKVLIPFEYTSIRKVSEYNLYKVKKGNTYCLMNGSNKVLNPGPFDDIALFEESEALSFYQGKMHVINKNGKFERDIVDMNMHVGYATFEDLKQDLIKALNSKDDQLIVDFCVKIAPSKHLLYYLKENVFSKEDLYYVDIDRIIKIYTKELLEFKYRYWKSEWYNQSSLTQVKDFTLNDRGIVTNARVEDEAFGDTRFMEKLLRNAIKVNGYWISTYFMFRNFDR